MSDSSVRRGTLFVGLRLNDFFFFKEIARFRLKWLCGVWFERNSVFFVLVLTISLIAKITKAEVTIIFHRQV